MKADTGHFSEIMDEVSRLGEYLREYCPEVSTVEIDQLLTEPATAEVEQLNTKRVGELLRHVANEA